MIFCILGLLLMGLGTGIITYALSNGSRVLACTSILIVAGFLINLLFLINKSGMI